MDIIKDKNRPNLFEIFFIIISFGGLVAFPLWDYPILFYSICFIIISFCLLLLMRTIEFSIDKNRISIKFSLWFITYRTIIADFDATQYANQRLSFCKDNQEILVFSYEDDYDNPSFEIGYLSVIYRNKKIDIGNKKTSFDLFDKIKKVSSKHIEQADT